MSEFELLNLDSPKSQSSNGKKSTATSSWADSIGHDKEEVPTHLFINSESASPQTRSSHSNKVKIRKKKSGFTQDYSLELKKTKKSKSVKKNADLRVSDETSSSDSEYVSSSSGKPKRFFKANRVCDFKNQDEINEITSDYEIKPSKAFGLKESKEIKKSCIKESSNFATKKSVASASDVPYRERIRDRFQIIKEKAVESLSRPHSRSHSRLKSLLPNHGTKMEDLLRQEEDRVVAAMERHERIKLRWQHMSRASLENKKKDYEESDSFFAESEKPNSPIESEVAEEQKSDVEAQESKLSVTELLGFNENWELVEYVKPKMTNPKQQKSWEEQLFYPSTKPVPLEDKLEPGLTPRYKEEEGLYVGKKIHVSKTRINKMECRVLKTAEGRKWFGKDGEFMIPACPLKPFATRPLFDEDENSSSVKTILKPATVRDADYRYMDHSGNLNYVFDIDISSVDFTHHPLFSREHVLAQRLKELYVKYKKKKESDNMSRITGRLLALRKTRDNLKIIINQGGDNLDFKEKLLKCENDIKEVRQLRYLEGQNDRQIINKILMTWKDLLKLRDDQNYQNTTVILDIKKTDSENLKQEREKFEEEIEQETQEITEELKRVHENEMEAYKKKYIIWSESIKNRKTRKEKEDLEDENADGVSESESSTDSEDDKIEIIEKPKVPHPVVEEEVRAQVIKNYKKSFRQPGEPEIDFILTQATSLDAPLYNNKEQLRRASVKRCMVFVKLFYNGKEVCRSKPQPLSQNFTVKITQRFAIRILEWPESLMFELHEENGALARNLLVPGIYLPFPDSFTTVYNSEVERHEFSSNIAVSYNHTAVGAGKKIIPCPGGSEFNNQAVCLYTSGTISCRVGWVVDDGKILSPPEKYWTTKTFEQTSLFEILKSGGIFDLSKLKEWAEKSKLDPNDPYNSAFIHFLENSETSKPVKPTHFRLNPLLSEFDFCTESEIENNPRLQMLKLRDMGELEFKDIKMVPLNEKQIHKEIFKDYEKRILTSNSLGDVLSLDPLEGHRIWGKKYLEQVHQNLLKQCRMCKQNKRFQDYITEESIPDVGTLGLTFMKWLRPKRPLHPERKERKKLTPQNLSGREINIVVNVVRAFEVPVRKDLDTFPGSESIEGFSLVNVRPFVEISFKGITARTTTAEGANPTWNQSLQIPVRSQNECYSPGSLQLIKDTLYLHLFDEIIIDLISDESARETNIHQRLERHWLASMEIPFSTLYFNAKIEGTFKLYSPPVLLGYEREAHRRLIGLNTGQESSIPQRDATYITLFVTVQPALTPPTPVKEKMESREAANLQKHLEGWHQEVTNMFPHRNIKTLVLDITGKSVCVTRFIKPLTLPPIVEEEKITPEMVARFVAMIPMAAENSIFPEYFDIWLTCDQVLRLLTGNCEDHAVLLCSYFLQLGLQSYVLLGSGIPRGSMAYVLVKEKSEKVLKYFVWDPSNGQKYNIDDSFCPLQKIHCLINDQNIWANIQDEELPRRTKFDLTRKADWFPVFGKNMEPPVGSVQPNSLLYRTTSRQAVDILRDKIEKKLRDNLMKWRKKNRTQWNRYCAATLRKLLPKLEEAEWKVESGQTPDHFVELQHILASHKMCGFPINMCYTNITAISEAVKATGVHCNESEGIEFALAVYIHAYPNDVLSVWVYVASLIRRR